MHYETSFHSFSSSNKIMKLYNDSCFICFQALVVVIVFAKEATKYGKENKQKVERIPILLGLKMWEVKECNVGTTTKMNASVVTSRIITTVSELKNIEYERWRWQQLVLLFCSQKGEEISSSSFICLLV